MARVIPTGRAYGKIGPNEFRVYQNDRGIESEDFVGEVINGHDWPGSMIKCHEGHLVGIMHAARYRLESGQRYLTNSAELRAGGESAQAEDFTRYGREALEFASVLVKIVKAEYRYFAQMSFQAAMAAVFEEADAFESTLKGLKEARFAQIDPVTEYTKQWGESDTAGKEASARLAQEEQARIRTEREQAARAKEEAEKKARDARRAPHIAGYDAMLQDPAALKNHRKATARLRRCERCNEVMTHGRGIFSRLLQRPYLCPVCESD